MPVFLLVLFVHSSVTLALTITLSQFAHPSSSFIPGHLHISYFCVPMFVWRVSMFICVCIHVCAGVQECKMPGPSGQQSQEAER